VDTLVFEFMGLAMLVLARRCLPSPPHRCQSHSRLLGAPAAPVLG